MLQKEYFPDMDILSLSGNFCTDKKHSAVNWCVIPFHDSFIFKFIPISLKIPGHDIDYLLKNQAAYLCLSYNVY